MTIASTRYCPGLREGNSNRPTESVTAVFRMLTTLIRAPGTGTVPPAVLSVLSPYRTGHINRFGTYELRDRDIGEVDYGLRLKASAAQKPARAQQR